MIVYSRIKKIWRKDTFQIIAPFLKGCQPLQKVYNQFVLLKVGNPWTQFEMSPEEIYLLIKTR